MTKVVVQKSQYFPEKSLDFDYKLRIWLTDGTGNYTEYARIVDNIHYSATGLEGMASDFITMFK